MENPSGPFFGRPRVSRSELLFKVISMRLSAFVLVCLDARNATNFGLGSLGSSKSTGATNCDFCHLNFVPAMGIDLEKTQASDFSNSKIQNSM